MHALKLMYSTLFSDFPSGHSGLLIHTLGKGID